MPSPPPRSARRRVVQVAAGLAAVAGLAAALAYEVDRTRPVREAVTAYSRLVTLANRPDLSDAQRLEAARGLYSRARLESHPPALAPEGGIAGLPRSIHKNFQAWREGPNVWICPTNRVGPVYQFVRESGEWRFDGLIGYLRPRGELVPATDLADPLLAP